MWNKPKKTAHFKINKLYPDTVLVEDMNPSQRKMRRGIIIDTADHKGIGKSVMYLCKNEAQLFFHNHIALSLVPKKDILASLEHITRQENKQNQKKFYYITEQLRTKVLHGVPLDPNTLRSALKTK